MHNENLPEMLMCRKEEIREAFQEALSKHNKYSTICKNKAYDEP